MELLNELYFAKSFVMIGDEKRSCFDCAYCRANNGEGLHFPYHDILKTDLFRKLPVAVNCFYGDPMLQYRSTKRYLSNLYDECHEGAVIVITKGDITKLGTGFLDMQNLHIGLSTFGIGGEEYDGGSRDRFLHNLDFCKENGYNCHIEFRPIIKNLNDSEESFRFVLETAKKYDVPVGYCGLQVSDSLRDRLASEKIFFEPYDERGFGLRKFLSDEVDSEFRALANEYGVPVFRKTSCLISYMDKKRDYNAHYYRRNEVGCEGCPNDKVCSACYDLINNDTDDAYTAHKILELNDIIPFDFKVEKVHNHMCALYRNGLCKFPSDDCTDINGNIIKINEQITTSDVRVIKWLTGYTVDANFVELPYISKKWLNVLND